MTKRETIQNYWKLQELRASVLTDLAEFVPNNFYANVHSDADLGPNDCYLALQLQDKHNKGKVILTPRQMAAVRLLDAIGMVAGAEFYKTEEAAADLADDVTIEGIKEIALNSLQAAWGCYSAYLNEDEARAFAPTNVEQSKDRKEVHQKWQRELETMAEQLIQEGKKSQAKKNRLARELSKKTGADAATIERNTRKTW